MHANISKTKQKMYQIKFTLFNKGIHILCDNCRVIRLKVEAFPIIFSINFLNKKYFFVNIVFSFYSVYTNIIVRYFLIIESKMLFTHY